MVVIALTILKTATLYVPKGMKVLYQARTGWKNFQNIVEIEMPDGINGITIDGQKDAIVYSLSGQKLSAPKKGINIVNGKKVVVK